MRDTRTPEVEYRQNITQPVSSADKILLSSTNSIHVTSPSCPDKVARTPWSLGDCRNHQLTPAVTEGEPACASQSATNFPEPNATREELEAAAMRLNLLAEAEIYSTDVLTAMSTT